MKATRNWMLDVSDQQYLIREAIQKDPEWTPTDQQLNDILIQLDTDACPSMISYLFKNIQVIQNRKTHWRTVNKGLKILNWALLRGTKSMFDEINTYRSFIQQIHDSFQYYNRYHEDRGQDVRDKAGETLRLLDNAEYLAQERDAAILVAKRLNTSVPSLRGDVDYHNAGASATERSARAGDGAAGTVSAVAAFETNTEHRTGAVADPFAYNPYKAPPVPTSTAATTYRTGWGVKPSSSPTVEKIEEKKTEDDFFGLESSVFEAFGTKSGSLVDVAPEPEPAAPAPVEVPVEKTPVVEPKVENDLDLLLGLGPAPVQTVDDLFETKPVSTNPFDEINFM